MSLVWPGDNPEVGEALDRAFDAIVNERENAARELITLKKELEAANTRISQLEADLSSCENECYECNEDMRDMRRALIERSAALEEAEKQIKDLREQLTYAYSN